MDMITRAGTVTISPCNEENCRSPADMPDFWLFCPLFICLFIMFNTRYQKGLENLGVSGALHSSTPFVRDIPKIFYYVEDTDPIKDFGRSEKKENQVAKPDLWRCCIGK